MASFPGPRTAAAPERDPAIDLLRALAITRVVLWHTFAAAWMTFVAAMPVLFFVAGVLLAASNEHDSPRAVMVRRLRRLLLPVWLYGAVVVLGGVLHAFLRQTSGFDAVATVGDVASWLFPAVDPKSSAMPHEWLTTHLWYIRAYVWVLILAPLLMRLARRLRLAMPLLCGGVVAVQMSARWDVPFLGSGAAHVVIGDAVTYGTFVVLGMAYRFRRPQWRVPTLIGGILVSLVALATYATWFGVPPGGVNGSYPMTFFAGLVWLFLAAAAEPWIRSVASRTPVRRATAALNRRAVTVYLWHPAAIVIAYSLVGRLRILDQVRPVAMAAVLAASVGLTVLATYTAGWMEDLAANRRRPRRRQGVNWRGLASPVATALAVTVAVVVLPLTPEPRALASRAGGSVQSVLPPPSYRPALTDASFTRRASRPPPGTLSLPGGTSDGVLQATLDRWLEEHPDVGSVAVGLNAGSATWAGDAHQPGAHSPARAGARYGVASITKTFTLALTLRAVDQGRILLDSPVPDIPGIPGPPDGTVITPRQLLEHTSGLVDYGNAQGYDSSVPLTPAEAVRLSLGTPLLAAPGERVTYANTNYHWLGVLLEHVNRRPYAGQVAQLAHSVGLRQTRVEPATGPGWPGFASGGIHSTVSDLARWGTALFAPGRVVPKSSATWLTALGPHNIGLGTWPLCPCSTDDRGLRLYAAIGQHTGHGGLYHTPEGVTFAVHMEPPMEGADVKTSSLIEAMLQTLRGQSRNVNR